MTTQSPGLKRPSFASTQIKWQDLPDITYADPAPKPVPSAKCDTTQVSQVPWDIFSPGVYSSKSTFIDEHFCAESMTVYPSSPIEEPSSTLMKRKVANILPLDFCNSLNGGDKTKSFTQTVDSKGNVIPSSKRRSLNGRTPPPDPNAYGSYTFDLKWTGGDGSCSSDCSNVYYTIAQSSCGHTSGYQNIMSSAASLDTGCGIYSYTIANTAAPTGPTIVSPVKKDTNSCNDPGLSLNQPFTLVNAQDAISQFCADDISLPQTSLPLLKSYSYGAVSIRVQIGWQYGGQTGCGSITNTDGSLQTSITPDQCSTYLLNAVNLCKF